jgi:hypothetical protein
MRLRARGSLLVLVTGVLLLLGSTAVAQAASEVPLVEKFVATNCKVSTCGQEDVLGPFFEPKPSISTTEAKAEGETQAGGRVPYGVTDFKMLTLKELTNEKGEKVAASYATGTVIPTSIVKHIRTDVAPGLATNPFAVKKLCTYKEFGESEAIAGSGLGFFVKGSCAAETEIGEQFATVFGGIPPQTGFEKQEGAGDLPLTGKVYDLEAPEGEKMANGAKLASLYGVALELPKPLTEHILKGVFKGSNKAAEEEQYYAHTLIKGNVEWGKETRGTDVGDFHDYFEIEVSTALPLVRSRLVFNGHSGNGAFITNATNCTNPANDVTSLRTEDKEGVESPVKSFTTPIGLEGCEEVPFGPGFSLASSTTLADQPNEVTAEATMPHNPKTTDDSQVKTATFTLPEGMTLNPAAAHGLEACTPKQAHQEGTVFGEPFGVECPAGSKIGTVNLNVPTLPDGSLTGNVYLGGPESGPITGPPYVIYVVANSEKYGVSVRLLGETIPNEATGQVTTVFKNPPEQPFTSISLHFERGVLSPIANPLLCGTPEGTASFVPTSAPTTSKNISFGTTVSGCAASTPAFEPKQATANQSSAPGANTSFTFSLERSDGQQYLSSVSTTLPEGLVGLIPSATQCGEAAANSETEECPSTSRLGTATVLAGSGPTPYAFSGPVYLTGPYKGAPFGLSVKVAAVAGPFNLGTVVARATINIDQYSARVTTADAEVPRIRRGIPIRLKKLTVAIEKQGFLINPTSCSALSTESTATGFSTVAGAAGGAVKLAAAPFQLSGCPAQAFKPTFAAATGAKTSRANGASLETTINEPKGQSNIKSVLVQLPAALPSRLTTLNKACPEATFNVNPYNCPSGSFVGGVRANTPTLPDKMKGPAILVSHGGEAFPDLDLILEADGVKVILVGNTDIKKGITKTHFAAPPDVPVSSITVNLPVGGHSALAAYGNFCTVPLVMPTTIEGQNGKVVTQNTNIKVAGCGVQVIGRKTVGHTLYLTIKTFAAGRVSVSGGGYGTLYRHYRGAIGRTSIKVSLRGGRRNVRVGFVPKNRKLGSSATFVKVTVR